LKNLDNDVDINRAWQTVRDNIKISVKYRVGYYKLKKNKPWFDEGCSKLLDPRKQVKLQWLQDPSEIYGNYLNNIRREAAGISGIKRGRACSTNGEEEECM
jgi:hypothetical protein